MSKHIFLSLLVTLLCTPYGCATVTRGTTETFLIESDPLGADVRLSTGETCKTPCTLTKKRKENFVVYVEKEGYEPIEMQIGHRTANAGAAGMAGNVVLGGLIGAAVDAGSGATQELFPNPCKVNLVTLMPSHETPMTEGAMPDETPSQDVTSTALKDELFMQKLRRFKKMNEEGIISDEEYETIRRKILGAQLKDVTDDPKGAPFSEDEVRPAKSERF